MGLFNKKKKPSNQPPVEHTGGQTSLQGDRNKLSVSGKQSKNKKKLLFIALFLLLVAIIGSVSLYSFVKSKQQKEIPVELSDADNAQYQRTDASNRALTDFMDKQERNNETLADAIDKEKGKINNKEVEPKEDKQDNSVILPPVTENSVIDKKQSGKDEITPEMRKNQGEILIAQNAIASPDKSNANQNTKDMAEERDGKRSEGDFLKGAHFADGSVGFIKNRQFLLSAGTSMPCVLKTKIVTNYPAVVMCQLTKNVYSDDGKNILIRSGALLQGEQTKVIKQGIGRVFVNWSTVKDRNINVRIDALGADGLGASGLPAWIDSHFWERFGGAIMLSFIDDAMAAAASHASNDKSDGVTVDNTRSTASNMAELALENSINIPPTAYVNQGEILTVIVPRNVDFSSVYKTE